MHWASSWPLRTARVRRGPESARRAGDENRVLHYVVPTEKSIRAPGLMCTGRKTSGRLDSSGMLLIVAVDYSDH
jgi:hypothetical protein